MVAEKVYDDIISQLLHNRGLKDKNSIANFFNQPHPEIITAQYPTYLKRVDPEGVEKAVNLIKNAVKDNRRIIIHGDYDVDGICGTAVLYQALKNLGANITYFVPDRLDEGYGLSIESLKRIQQTINGSPLLITTDCGITAIDEVNYAKSLGFDVIITDHHTPGPSLPETEAIVWTDELAGAGIAWLLASRITRIENLDLVALATIADIQPLTGVNRALVKYGLEKLNPTSRVGLKELIRVSGLGEKKIGTYEIGWMLAPRLNASGRLQNATDSLKLLITDDPVEAQNLAAKLNQINLKRQQITLQAVNEAREQHHALRDHQDSKLILLAREAWHEGVIGLVAGKIREEFYRPAVIISKGEKISKGSARSISGFNIVEAIRQCQEFLIDAGGHKMAAGFTIETAQIPKFQEKLLTVAGDRLPEESLTPTLSVDIEVVLEDLSWDLMENLKKFEPFGVGNPRPVFLTKSVQVLNVRPVGSDGKHLRLQIKSTSYELPATSYSVIGFGSGEWAAKLRPGDLIDIVYNLEENNWNGQKTLQLKLKDLRKTAS